jgi:preprotein translocase subunit SecF
MSAWSDMYRDRNDFDFPRQWKAAVALSLVLVVVSIGSLFTRGLNLSIDFEGGSIWEVPSDSFTESDARAALEPFGDEAAERFQEATTSDGRVLRISGRVDDVATATEIGATLTEAAGLEEGQVGTSTVGPSWGEDITRQARNSLIVFLVLIALYITWRLEARMAASALVAVVHDIIITVGVYSVLQLQVTPATVVSFLTILGFSLYDTIVVYDRVQESANKLSRTGRYTYTAIMRHALNRTFMRSVNTTLTTILPILSLLIVGNFVLGQRTIGDFAVALLVGLISGAYSSLYIAAPVTTWLKEREPRWRDIRSKLVAKGVDVGDTSWHGADGAAAGTSIPARPSRSGRTAAPRGAAAPAATAVAVADPDPDGPEDASPPVPTARPATHPPRPRKKKRR